MSLRASSGYFLKNGKPHFLISGEIHYFRIDPRLWKRHLVLLKQSGADTTSTYVPWDWHEYAEGKFDFTGETHPARDLAGYIELCKKVGLDLILKPGPYILAEYKHHGIPVWLVERNVKNALALDEQGNPLAPDRMSYLSEEFLGYVWKWYDKVMPIIAEGQEEKGGPVVMMQVCNEVGILQWLSGRIDYSPSVRTEYRAFLETRYRTVEDLNQRYGTNYSSFDAVEPPRGCIRNQQEYRAYVDFHRFFLHYFAKYLETLIKRIRGYGINVQLSHNIPGWIYGSASELPMLVSTYGEVFKRIPEVSFGLDHIPEFSSFRNAHADLACNKVLEAVQPGGPVWGAEFQAGSREHPVRNDPLDMALFYTASLAHGLKGMNYYMFSQGLNPEGKGFAGDKFYFQTPLLADGSKSELYAVVKKHNAFIRREGAHLIESRTKARICVGFYQPHFHTFLTSNQLLREQKLDAAQLGLSLDPRYVREELWFNGLLRSLQTLNLNYDVRDIQTFDGALHRKYKQLWVLTNEVMDLETQKFLADYVRVGGHLIVGPTVPTLDEYLHPCTDLADALGVRTGLKERTSRVNTFGILGLHSSIQSVQILESTDAEVIATTDSGKICGIRKKMGEGWATVLGYAIGYSTEEHLELYARIARLDRIGPEVLPSDPDIQAVVRRSRKNQYLFLLNFHNRKKTFTIGSKKYSLGPFGHSVIKTNVKRS